MERDDLIHDHQYSIAANHDGDSDSTASIAGQIYGAWHGESIVPVTWIEKLDIKELMDQLIKDFKTTPSYNLNGHIKIRVGV